MQPEQPQIIRTSWAHSGITFSLHNRCQTLNYRFTNTVHLKIFSLTKYDIYLQLRRIRYNSVSPGISHSMSWRRIEDVQDTHFLMQNTPDTTDVPEISRSGLTTIRFCESVTMQVLSESKLPKTLTTSPTAMCVSALQRQQNGRL